MHIVILLHHLPLRNSYKKARDFIASIFPSALKLQGYAISVGQRMTKKKEASSNGMME